MPVDSPVDNCSAATAADALCRLALCLGLLASLAPAAGARAQDTGATDSGSVQVRTTALRRGSLPRQVSAYGTMQPDPVGRDSAVAPVAAVVERVYVREGEAIRAGSPLVRLRPTPESSVGYVQAVSALRVASDSLQHTQRLLAQHLATAQQLAEAEKSLGDARATLDALQTQGAGGPRLLRAPFDGLIMHVSVSSHQWVAEGAALLDLARLSGLVLVAGVPPDNATDIAVGDPASVLPLGGIARYAAHVVSRGAVIDGGSGLTLVLVAFDGQPLPAGQAARAIITTGTVTGYIVPHSAVLLDDTGQSYVVQSQGGVAHRVPVRVLAGQDDQSAIDGPLDANAPLVLAGNYQAEEGMRLTATAVPAAAPASRTR
jgi:membrane fusion protein, multidrug efflux system